MEEKREKRMGLIVVLSIILFWVVIVFIITQNKHICKDPIHITCDSNCECDGLQCP
jgi:hypothetical protein